MHPTSLPAALTIPKKLRRYSSFIIVLSVCVGISASIFAAACAVTIMTRIHGGYQTLKRLESDRYKPIKEVNNGK